MQALDAMDGMTESLSMQESRVRTARAGEEGVIVPQSSTGDCPTCGAAAAQATGMAETHFVYAVGRIEARFPTLSLEKEFMQAAGRADPRGQTDQATFHAVLTERSNRYLARRLCWVLLIEGLESYLLVPRDTADLDLLIEAVRPRPSPLDVDVVIGLRGPIAGPELCNGLMLPIVLFDQIYSFDAPTLIQAIPRPAKMSKEQFEPAAQELFARIMQMADNAGMTDEHRALNYLAVRAPEIYTAVADAFARNRSLSLVEVLPSRLSGTRRVLDVIFSFTHRESGVVEQQFMRVDATDEFPFLVTRLSPYFGR